MSDINVGDIQEERTVYDYATVARRGLFCNQCELKGTTCNNACNKVLEEDLRED
jgi:hypothetical protein